MKKSKNDIAAKAAGNVFSCYCLLFLIAFGLTFSVVFALKKCFVLNTDGFNEYYPIYLYTGRYLRAVFGSLVHLRPMPLYDFCIGFGDDIPATLNYFGLGDIFNVTAAFAPVRFAPVVFTLTSILKIFTAGLSFIHWQRGRRAYSNTALAAGAVVYCLGGYTLAFGIIFPPFLTVLVYFPFVLRYIDWLFLKKKSDRWEMNLSFVLAIALQGLSGFYFLYMEFIFGLLYFIVMFLYTRKKVWKTAGVMLLEVLSNAAIGAGIAAAMLIPSVVAFLSSTRTGEAGHGKESLFSLFSLAQVMDRLDGIYAGPAFGAGLGLSLPLVIAVFYVCTHKGMQVLRTMLAVLLAAYMLPGTGLLLNGMNYSTDRWVFVIYAMLGWVMTEWLDSLETSEEPLRIGHPVILFIVTFVFWAAAGVYTEYWEEGEFPSLAVRAVWILGFSAVFLFQAWRCSGKKLAFTAALFAALSVGLTGFINNAPHVIGGEGYHTMFMPVRQVNERIENSEFYRRSKESAIQGFFRTDICDTALNGSLVTGTNGTTSYLSISNGHIYDFMHNQLMSGSIRGMSIAMQGLEGRAIDEMLLSTDWYALDDSAENVRQNPFYLPMGFLMDSWVDGNDPAAADPLDRYAALMQGVILDPVDGAVPAKTPKVSPERKWRNLSFAAEALPGDGDTAETLSEGAFGRRDDIRSISFSLTDADAREALLTGQYELFLFLHDFVYYGEEIWKDLPVQGRFLRVRPAGSYAGQKDDFMVRIEPAALEEDSFSLLFPEGEFSCAGAELRLLDLTGLEQVHQKLRAETLENLAVTARSVSGQIRNPGDAEKFLFMSIPFSSGWTCRLDGEEVPVRKADDGFMCIVVPSGDHTVEFSYMTPGMVIGRVLSAVSIVLTIVLAWRCRRGSFLAQRDF